jgi:hypothetical protein
MTTVQGFPPLLHTVYHFQPPLAYIKQFMVLVTTDSGSVVVVVVVVAAIIVVTTNIPVNRTST